MSYNQLLNWQFRVGSQAVLGCYTIIVNKSRPILEFLSSEWASNRRMVVMISHQNN